LLYNGNLPQKKRAVKAEVKMMRINSNGEAEEASEVPSLQKPATGNR
jgi:hypothetical protein